MSQLAYKDNINADPLRPGYTGYNKTKHIICNSIAVICQAFCNIWHFGGISAWEIILALIIAFGNNTEYAMIS